MNTLTCKSTFGFFAWVAKCVVPQEVLVILAAKGLLQILQRTPASEAEKAMANALGLWSEKRPKDFERKSIPFTEPSATILREHLGGEHEIEDGVKINVEIETKYHPLGATAEPKFAQEKIVVARHVKDGDFLDWIRDTVGFKGEVTRDHDENIALLSAVRDLKIKLMQAM